MSFDFPTSFTKLNLRSFEAPLKASFGIKLPGITSESRDTVLKLLDQNNHNFDIFFKKGFHNHCVHHLLAAYSCGASPDLLKSIYEKNTKPLKPRHPPSVDITKDNWTNYLGDEKLWTDYFNFFEGMIKENGMVKTFETYAFHPDMIHRLFAGALHPIIHIGYGFEFQLPLILAEGLAEAAVEGTRFEKLMNEQFWASKGSQTSLMDIITAVQEDKSLDSALSYTDDMKIAKLLSERLETVRDYATKWSILDTEEGVDKAAQELYETCALAFGATAIRPDKQAIKMDFFLMHGLTSVYFVTLILPFLDLQKRIALLRGEFAAVLSWYISRGRPLLHLDTLKNFSPKKLKDKPNPWLDIVKHGLLEDEDAHLIKVIRSLIRADENWGSEKGSLFVKIAQMAVESFEKHGWSHNGIGFEEEWTDDPFAQKDQTSV